MPARLILALTVALTLAADVFAHHERFTTFLTGHAESPSNTSAGFGHVIVTLDLDLLTMQVEADFGGLEGNVTAAHIHAPTAEPGMGIADVATQVPTFVDFPTGVTQGAYDKTFPLSEASTYNPAFITSTGGIVSTAMNTLIHALEDGKAYFNIHTTVYGGGEIRGFLNHVPGDYNDNGAVDAADYVVWRNSLNETGEGLKADSNNDNVIDEEDYLAWRANFGAEAHNHSHGGAGSGSATSVPEPSTLIFGWVLLGTISIGRVRRIRAWAES